MAEFHFLAFGVTLHEWTSSSEDIDKVIICVVPREESIKYLVRDEMRFEIKWDNLVDIRQNPSANTQFQITTNYPDPRYRKMVHIMDQKEDCTALCAFLRLLLNGASSFKRGRLIAPTVAKKGAAKKRGRLRKVDRFLVLVRGRLLVFRDPDADFPLSSIFLTKASLYKIGKSAISIVATIERKEVEFHFANQHERDDWYSALDEESRRASANRNFLDPSFFLDIEAGAGAGAAAATAVGSPATSLAGSAGGGAASSAAHDGDDLGDGRGTVRRRRMQRANERKAAAGGGGGGSPSDSPGGAGSPSVASSGGGGGGDARPRLGRHQPLPGPGAAQHQSPPHAHQHQQQLMHQPPSTPARMGTADSFADVPKAELHMFVEGREKSIGFIEIQGMGATLADIRGVCNQMPEAPRNFVFLTSRGASIRVRDEHNYSADDFLPRIVLADTDARPQQPPPQQQRQQQQQQHDQSPYDSPRDRGMDDESEYHSGTMMSVATESTMAPGRQQGGHDDDDDAAHLTIWREDDRSEPFLTVEMTGDVEQAMLADIREQCGIDDSLSFLKGGMVLSLMQESFVPAKDCVPTITLVRTPGFVSRGGPPGRATEPDNAIESRSLTPVSDRDDDEPRRRGPGAPGQLQQPLASNAIPAPTPGALAAAQRRAVEPSADPLANATVRLLSLFVDGVDGLQGQIEIAGHGATLHDLRPVCQELDGVRDHFVFVSSDGRVIVPAEESAVQAIDCLPDLTVRNVDAPVASNSEARSGAAGQPLPTGLLPSPGGAIGLQQGGGGPSVPLGGGASSIPTSAEAQAMAVELVLEGRQHDPPFCALHLTVGPIGGATLGEVRVKLQKLGVAPFDFVFVSSDGGAVPKLAEASASCFSCLRYEMITPRLLVRRIDPPHKLATNLEISLFGSDRVIAHVNVAGPIGKASLADLRVACTTQMASAPPNFVYHVAGQDIAPAQEAFVSLDGLLPALSLRSVGQGADGIVNVYVEGEARPCAAFSLAGDAQYASLADVRRALSTALQRVGPYAVFIQHGQAVPREHESQMGVLEFRTMGIFLRTTQEPISPPVLPAQTPSHVMTATTRSPGDAAPAAGDPTGSKASSVANAGPAGSLPPPPPPGRPASPSPSAAMSSVSTRPPSPPSHGSQVSAYRRSTTNADGSADVIVRLEGTERPLGLLHVPSREQKLSETRPLLLAEVDDVPSFSFLTSDGVPIGRRQEARMTVGECLDGDNGLLLQARLGKPSVAVMEMAPHLEVIEARSRGLSRNEIMVVVEGREKDPIGFLDFDHPEATTLAEAREQIVEELDGVPDDFSFLKRGLRVGKRQEAKLTIGKLLSREPSRFLVLRGVAADATPGPTAPVTPVTPALALGPLTAASQPPAPPVGASSAPSPPSLAPEGGNDALPAADADEVGSQVSESNMSTGSASSAGGAGPPAPPGLADAPGF